MQPINGSMTREIIWSCFCSKNFQLVLITAALVSSITFNIALMSCHMVSLSLDETNDERGLSGLRPLKAPTTVNLSTSTSMTVGGEGGNGAVTMPFMRLLSNPDTFSNTMAELYHKYGAEIAEHRPIMRKWCETTRSCKFGDYEAEMLYMLVREHKPENVFEMAPNRGYSSHWILKALHLNDSTSKLHSFDIHDSSVKFMNEEFKPRWVFTLGDYAKLYDEGSLDMEKFDFIFVDALHEPEFARGYCKRLFANHKRKSTVVAIHDIVANEAGGGRESEEVYKYLAFAGNAQNVFTVSRFAMPNSLYKPQTEKILPMINSIRADKGIVKPCSTTDCDRWDHDYLYFENNDAPTIFFTLN